MTWTVLSSLALSLSTIAECDSIAPVSYASRS